MRAWRRAADRAILWMLPAAAAALVAAVAWRWQAPPPLAAASRSGAAEMASPPIPALQPGEHRGPSAEAAVDALERKFGEESP